MANTLGRNQEQVQIALVHHVETTETPGNDVPTNEGDEQAFQLGCRLGRIGLLLLNAHMGAMRRIDVWTSPQPQTMWTAMGLIRGIRYTNQLVPIGRQVTARLRVSVDMESLRLGSLTMGQIAVLDPRAARQLQEWQRGMHNNPPDLSHVDRRIESYAHLIQRGARALQYAYETRSGDLLVISATTSFFQVMSELLARAGARLTLPWIDPKQAVECAYHPSERGDMQLWMVGPTRSPWVFAQPDSLQLCDEDAVGLPQYPDHADNGLPLQRYDEC